MSTYFKRKFENQLKNAEKLNLKQVAYYLCVSERTIHYWAKKHGLPKRAGRGTGTQTYYRKKEIDHWVKKNHHLVIR